MLGIKPCQWKSNKRYSYMIDSCSDHLRRELYIVYRFMMSQRMSGATPKVAEDLLPNKRRDSDSPLFRNRNDETSQHAASVLLTWPPSHNLLISLRPPATVVNHIILHPVPHNPPSKPNRLWAQWAVLYVQTPTVLVNPVAAIHTRNAYNESLSEWTVAHAARRHGLAHMIPASRTLCPEWMISKPLISTDLSQFLQVSQSVRWHESTQFAQLKIFPTDQRPISSDY